MRNIHYLRQNMKYIGTLYYASLCTCWDYTICHYSAYIKLDPISQGALVYLHISQSANLCMYRYMMYSSIIRHPILRTRWLMVSSEFFFFFSLFFSSAAAHPPQLLMESLEWSRMTFIFGIGLLKVATHARGDFWCNAHFWSNLWKKMWKSVLCTLTPQILFRSLSYYRYVNVISQ